MLRLLFQSLEQTLGPALSSLAFLSYWVGMIALAVTLLVLICRRWMELEARNFGIQQHWVMTCRTCARQTIVTRRFCGYCEADLNIPGALVLWTGATRKQDNRRRQTITWTVHLVGTLTFVLTSVWLLNGFGALSPEGELHRLFLGLALLSWAALGWFGGRVLHVGRIGILSRLRDGVMALASVGLLALSLLLATQISSVPETLLARFSTDGRGAQIGDRRLPLPEGKIGFEYLQLDHNTLGYHQVLSLAFLGNERIPAPGYLLTQPLANHLQKHADAYAARGLTVRLRTDRVQVRANHSYEVIDRGGQVLIRRMQQT